MLSLRDQGKRQRGAREDRAVRPIDPIGNALRDRVVRLAQNGSHGKKVLLVRRKVAQGRKSDARGRKVSLSFQWPASVSAVACRQRDASCSSSKVGAPSTTIKLPARQVALAGPCFCGKITHVTGRSRINLGAMVFFQRRHAVPRFWIRRASRSARVCGPFQPLAALLSSATRCPRYFGRGTCQRRALHSSMVMPCKFAAQLFATCAGIRPSVMPVSAWPLPAPRC